MSIGRPQPPAGVDARLGEGQRAAMSWEERLLAVFDDLEQQAEGLALAERDAEVAELGRAAYAAVDLGSRLHAAPGHQLSVGVLGVGTVSGRVARVGTDFVLLDGDQVTWLVRVAVITRVAGLPDRALATGARGLPARVGLGSVLRGFAESTVPLSLHAVDTAVTHGRIRRVGADFVELWQDAAGARSRTCVLVPFAALAAVRALPGD